MKRLKPHIIPVILAVFALALCIVMSVHALSGTHMIGCSAGSACDSVLGSRWSMLLGFLPVSVLAVGLYLAMLICLGYLAFSSDREIRQWCGLIICVLAGAIIGSAVWFSLIQAFILKAFCKYCITVHVAGILLSVTVLFKYRSVNTVSRNIAAFSAGLGAAVILAFAQLLFSPSEYYDEGYADGIVPAVSRIDVPVIGSSDAEFPVLLLYDYQCPHCQRLHSVLDDIVRDYEGKLCFVLCPSPLSPECNPYVPASDIDLFKGSCTLAKLALSLWQTDNEAFRTFDSWLFAPEGGEWHPRTEQEAFERAESYMTEEELRNCISSPRMIETMSVIYDIFGRTGSDGKGGLPRLVYGQQWIVPEVVDTEGIENMLESVFSLEKTK